MRHVEAKYPALLFKQQLTAYVEKIYAIMRDNLKKELAPVLTNCIQVRCILSGQNKTKQNKKYKKCQFFLLSYSWSHLNTVQPVLLCIMS